MDINSYFTFNTVTTKDYRYKIIGNRTKNYQFLKLEKEIPFILNKWLRIYNELTTFDGINYK